MICIILSGQSSIYLQFISLVFSSYQAQPNHAMKTITFNWPILRNIDIK